MSLVDQYRAQREWRDWPAIFAALPAIEPGQRVLDLGCGVGDQSAELVARGARVIGVDINPELLEAARSRGLPGAEFRLADLREPLELDAPVAGVWSSFTAAYLCDLSIHLARWRELLEPAGWIALTEVDDLFAHEPLDPAVAAVLDAHVASALEHNRYDFRMGRELAAHLECAGFAVERTLTVGDRELCFDGPAPPEIAAAWAARLDRLALRQRPDFAAIKAAFIDALGHPEHRSRASVWCCLARRPR